VGFFSVIHCHITLIGSTVVSTLYPCVSMWFYLLYIEGFITKHSFCFTITDFNTITIFVFSPSLGESHTWKNKRKGERQEMSQLSYSMRVI